VPGEDTPARAGAGVCADLHAHSTVSDGWHGPRHVVDLQAAHGVQLAALTDHDTFAGVEAAHRQAALRGIRFVVGAEITAAPPRANNHLLAHGVRTDDTALTQLLRRNVRVWRAEAAAALTRLRAQGIDLSDPPELADEHTLVMPHSIARTAIRRKLGGHDAVWHQIDEALRHVPRRVYTAMPAPAEIAEAVHGAGGLVVWAHPGRSGVPADMLAALDHFDAVEVYTPRHSPEVVAELERLCANRNLPTTTGCDFHGYPGYARPRRDLDPAYLDLLLQRVTTAEG
jgi:predicted metal-dependent phosphoesterase TrpH